MTKTATQDNRPQFRRLRRTTAPAGYCVVGWWTTLGGLVAIVLGDVGFAMLLAPILLLLSVMTSARAIMAGNLSARHFSAAQAMLPVVLFCLCGGVWFLTFSVEMVRIAVPAATAAYLVVTAPWVWRIWRRRARAYPPGHCQQCGYMLIGLKDDRCPECGERFNPDVFRFDPEAIRAARDAAGPAPS